MIIARGSGRLFIRFWETKQAKGHVTGDVATTWLATCQIRVTTELMKRIQKDGSIRGLIRGLGPKQETNT